MQLSLDSKTRTTTIPYYHCQLWKRTCLEFSNNHNVLRLTWFESCQRAQARNKCAGASAFELALAFDSQLSDRVKRWLGRDTRLPIHILILIPIFYCHAFAGCCRCLADQSLPGKTTRAFHGESRLESSHPTMMLVLRTYLRSLGESERERERISQLLSLVHTNSYCPLSIQFEGLRTRTLSLSHVTLYDCNLSATRYIASTRLTERDLAYFNLNKCSLVHRLICSTSLSNFCGKMKQLKRNTYIKCKSSCAKIILRMRYCRGDNPIWTVKFKIEERLNNVHSTKQVFLIFT